MGIRLLQNNTGSGTITSAYGLQILTPVNSGGGAITTSYGIYIQDQNVGTSKYAIYTNSGAVHFGDSVDLASGKNLTITAGNIITDTTTGTKFGTSTSQKLAFYNSTPIVQITTGVGAATFTANAGTAINDASTFDGYTLGQIVKALRNLGLLA